MISFSDLAMEKSDNTNNRSKSISQPMIMKQNNVCLLEGDNCDDKSLITLLFLLSYFEFVSLRNNLVIILIHNGL